VFWKKEIKKQGCKKPVKDGAALLTLITLLLIID